MIKKIIKLWYLAYILIIFYLAGWISNRYQFFPYYYLQEGIYNTKLIINNINTSKDFDSEYYCNENFGVEKKFEEITY